MNYKLRIDSRKDFLHLIENNKGMLILKFGADWCGPCKRIEGEVYHFFDVMINAGKGNVMCGDINIDESMDVYSFLKSNKRVNGIPVIFCYIKGNHNGIIPTYSVTGADQTELLHFFNRCRNALSVI